MLYIRVIYSNAKYKKEVLTYFCRDLALLLFSLVSFLPFCVGQKPGHTIKWGRRLPQKRAKGMVQRQLFFYSREIINSTIFKKMLLSIFPTIRPFYLYVYLLLWMEYFLLLSVFDKSKENEGTR